MANTLHLPSRDALLVRLEGEESLDAAVPTHTLPSLRAYVLDGVPPGRPREVSDVWTWIAVGLFLAAWVFCAG
jgi:hypothetical protein